MLRDEARAFLEAGGRDRVRRHGAADAARRAARPAARAPRPRCATARRWRCCRRSAASRPSAARCPAPPNARPVARFLLFERAYPDSVAASVDARCTTRSTRADRAPRRSGRCCGSAGWSPTSSSAAAHDAGRSATWRRLCEQVQARARARRRRHRRALLRRRARRRGRHRRSHELRHPLPHRVPLRRARSPTTSTRCACARRRRRPSASTTSACAVDPEARLHRHLDYFGTEVIEFGVAAPHDHLAIDVRARVVTRRAARAARRRLGRARAPTPTARRPASSCCPAATSPTDGALDELRRLRARRARRWRRCGARAS